MELDVFFEQPVEDRDFQKLAILYRKRYKDIQFIVDRLNGNQSEFSSSELFDYMFKNDYFGYLEPKSGMEKFLRMILLHIELLRYPYVPQQAVLYRLIDLDQAEDWKLGDSLAFPRISSCSFDLSGAETSGRQNHNVLFVIQAVEHSRARDISRFGFPHEKEVIFPAGTKFYVQGIEHENRQVNLEAIRLVRDLDRFSTPIDQGYEVSPHFQRTIVYLQEVAPEVRYPAFWDVGFARQVDNVVALNSTLEDMSLEQVSASQLDAFIEFKKKQANDMPKQELLKFLESEEMNALRNILAENMTSNFVSRFGLKEALKQWVFSPKYAQLRSLLLNKDFLARLLDCAARIKTLDEADAQHRVLFECANEWTDRYFEGRIDGISLGGEEARHESIISDFLAAVPAISLLVKSSSVLESSSAELSQNAWDKSWIFYKQLCAHLKSILKESGFEIPLAPSRERLADEMYSPLKWPDYQERLFMSAQNAQFATDDLSRRHLKEYKGLAAEVINNGYFFHPLFVHAALDPYHLGAVLKHNHGDFRDTLKDILQIIGVENSKPNPSLEHTRVGIQMFLRLKLLEYEYGARWIENQA